MPNALAPNFPWEIGPSTAGFFGFDNSFGANNLAAGTVLSLEAASAFTLDNFVLANLDDPGGKYPYGFTIDYNAGTTAYTLMAGSEPLPAELADTPFPSLGAIPLGAMHTEPDALIISNTGEGTLSWTISDDADWLQCTPIGGSTSTENDSVTIIINTSGLHNDQTYSATITIDAASARTASVAISFSTSETPAELAVVVLSPLDFGTVPVGTTETWDDVFMIRNQGKSGFSWTITSHAAWLTCSPTSGTTSIDEDTIGIVVNTRGLDSGEIYSGTITVDAGSAGTQSLNVSFAIESATEEDPVVYYFPHVATNAAWETEIGIINTGSEQAKGTLGAMSSTGEEVAARSLTLESHARRAITVSEEFEGQAANIRYIVYETTSEDMEGYTKFWDEGRYRAAVPVVKEVNTGGIPLSHIASNDNCWNGVALVNTNDNPVVLNVVFDNAAMKAVSLAAGEHRKFTIQSLFDEDQQPDIASAVITNGAGIIRLELFGSTESSGKSYLSGVILTEETATDLYYPHVASNATWWTGVVAYNPTPSSQTLTVTPFRADGFALTEATLLLESGEKYIGTVEKLALPLDTAWLALHSTGGITGFQLFGTRDGKALGGYTGVNIKGSEGVLPSIEKNGWTGIAFVNLENHAATITLTAYDDSGLSIATKQIILTAHEKWVGKPEDLFETDITAATYIAYSSDGEVVSFQLNGSDDGMMVDALEGM